jgi:hypothetical protein
MIPHLALDRLFYELQQAFGIVVPVVKEKKDWKQICRNHLNYNPDLCPCCGKGTMITIDVFQTGRPPPVQSLEIAKAVMIS